MRYVNISMTYTDGCRLYDIAGYDWLSTTLKCFLTAKNIVAIVYSISPTIFIHAKLTSATRRTSEGRGQIMLHLQTTSSLKQGLVTIHNMKYINWQTPRSLCFSSTLQQTNAIVVICMKNLWFVRVYYLTIYAPEIVPDRCGVCWFQGLLFYWCFCYIADREAILKRNTKMHHL